MNSYGQPSAFHIVAHPDRVRVLFQGHELADSDDVMVLNEDGHDPVFYFPIKDVQMSSLQANRHTTRGAYGDANFYTIMRDGHVIEDVAWCYGEPLADAEGIAGRIAFDRRHVEFQRDDAPGERIAPHVPAHDPPYSDSLDPMDRGSIPSTPSPRTPG